MRNLVTLAIFGLIFTAAGCDKKADSAGTAASASAHESASATPAPTATAVARENPKDIDLPALQAELSCSGAKGKNSNVCSVLEGFSKGEKWDGKTPSGKGAWVGWAYTLKKGEESKERMVLVSRTVPTAKVGPSDLPIMVSTGVIPDKLQHDWEKMLRKLGHGNRVSDRNQCIRFIDGFEPQIERGAIFTNGASTQLIADEDVYLRKEGIKHLYYVAPSMSRDAAKGDGKYARLWMAVW